MNLLHDKNQLRLHRKLCLTHSGFGCVLVEGIPSHAHYHGKDTRILATDWHPALFLVSKRTGLRAVVGRIARMLLRWNTGAALSLLGRLGSGVAGFGHTAEATLSTMTALEIQSS